MKWVDKAALDRDSTITELNDAIQDQLVLALRARKASLWAAIEDMVLTLRAGEEPVGTSAYANKLIKTWWAVCRALRHQDKEIVT